MDNKYDFFYSCKHGDFKKVEEFLEMSPPIVDIEEKNQNDKTAIIIASEEGHFKLVKFLLSKSANYEAQDDVGYTSLMYSCLNNHIKIVRILVYAGANVEEINNYNERALFISCIKNHIEIVKFLIEESEANIEIKDINFQYPPIYYLNSDNQKKIKEFIENINMKKANIKPVKR
jgi:ankyrin repeat protein